MRKKLLAAAALAPLWFLASQTSAAAQTTISNSTSTPATTAADGDITLTGTITANAPNTQLITVNSNNSVTVTGSLSSTGYNNVVGIAIQGGFTGSVLADGTINIGESFTPSNLNNVNEEPFASPTSTGRYGIRLTGTQPFTGDINNELTISVQGNQSYGVSLEAPLNGNLINSGTITLTGNAGAGIQVLQPVSGGILINGGITVLGQNSYGANIAGAVSGALEIYSTITTTDYGLTTRPGPGTALQSIQATPTEVDPKGGTALAVSGSVAGGIFLGAPPPYTNASDTVSESDGSGVLNSAETTSTISTYGAGPAMIVGGPQAITIGGFQTVPTGTPNANNGYGIIVEGDVYGFGVYDNVTSTALQIGGLGGAVTVAGGLRVVGNIEATGYGDVNPTAIAIGAGASAPTIDNEGAISASVSPPNSTTSTFPSFNATATGISIAAGATVNTLINNGVISATISGDANDVVSTTAVVDRGGGISTVTNTGTIESGFQADQVGAVVTGTPITLANGSKVNASGTIALDLSNNTTGVTLTQSEPPITVVTTVTTSGVPVVTVSTTPVPAGTYPIVTTITETTTTTGNTTVETIVPVSPSITGDIYLGNGPNVVNILAGTVVGALSLGSGPTASVTIDNGAVYAGDLSYTGTSGAGLTLNVNNGTLESSDVGTIKTASLSVGSTGLLYFGIDPANNRAVEYVDSGAATVAAGGKLGLVFVSNSATPQTFTLISSPNLSAAGTNAALLGPVPYMFNATLNANPTAGTVTVSITQKTPAQLGLNPSQSAALNATYQAIALDGPVQTAFLDQYSKTGFLGVYNQILPDYAGGTFQAANAASLAISRATSESNDIENPSGSRGAWAQELFIGVNQGSGQTDGFQGGGFGFVGGLETGGSGLGAFGVTAAIIETTVADPHVQGNSYTSMSELEVGSYWQGEINGFTLDARVGVGYTWMGAKRQLIETNADGDITLDREVKDNWNGYTASGRFGVAYKVKFGERFLGGGWFVQPQTHVDTFMLYENAYNENEAEGGPALAMGFNSVTGQETSATASILVGRAMGTGVVFRPELEFGVRDVFTGNAGDTTARYISGGPSFVLTPADIEGAAGVARFKLKASSEYYELGFEAGGEVLSSRYEEGDMRLSVRVLF